MNQVSEQSQQQLHAEAMTHSIDCKDVETPVSNCQSAVNVSIIIPVYNTAEYLPQCLESAINQTLKDIEIIVIDDASTDNSLQIIRHYQSTDERIKVIVFAENQGNGFGRNEAMRQATGNYLMFLDSDDWLDENAVEIIYRKATAKSFDVVVYGHLSHQLELITNRIVQQKCLPTLIDSDPYAFKYLLQQRKGLSCMPWQYFVAKENVTSNGILFSEGIYFEDVIFTIKALYFAKNIGVVKQSLYNYRRRSGSITLSASKKKIADMFISLDIVKQFLEEEGVFNIYQREYLIRFLMFGVCYSFLDYFKLSKKDRDYELDSHMEKLRKSKILGRENLLFLKRAINELDADETRSKSFYLLCYRIMSSLVHSYSTFKFSYKLIVWINNYLSNLYANLEKAKVSLVDFRLPLYHQAKN